MSRLPIRWRFLENERGAAAIEFAIVLPILVSMLVAALEVGLAFNAKSTLSQATSDGADILAGMPAGRLDGWSPAAADAIEIADYVGYRLTPAWTTWSATAEEFTQGLGIRTIAEAGDPTQCELPPAPDLSQLNLVAGERVAILRTCLMDERAFSSTLIGPHHFTETRVLPMRRPLPRSCRELAELGETRNGIYLIDADANGPAASIEANCDMADGGWTMVAAQFETDPESWNAGTDASYDSTLSTGTSFALSSDQIPPHSATGLAVNAGSGMVVLPVTYTTGDIDLAGIAGSGGISYDLYRNQSLSHPDLDPESGPETDIAPDLVDCLVLDRVGAAGFDWAFCPNAAAPEARGAALSPDDRRTISDNAAWTIWVR